MMIPSDVAEILPRKTAQHVAKDFDRGGDLTVVQMAISHDKAARGRRFGVVRRERRQTQSATLRPACQRAVIAASRERGRYVQAGAGALELEPAADSVAKKFGKRAEKIGIVASDKMMKTVTVRVDRLVKHPVYRKYVKKRKKFMAHDDMGAKIGDKVKIVETRPMSARKRWRVVEIIQKAEL